MAPNLCRNSSALKTGCSVVPEGLVAQFRHAKSDQEGEGAGKLTIHHEQKHASV
jgi:hypothetical protein